MRVGPLKSAGCRLAPQTHNWQPVIDAQHTTSAAEDDRWPLRVHRHHLISKEVQPRELRDERSGRCGWLQCDPGRSS